MEELVAHPVTLMVLFILCALFIVWELDHMVKCDWLGGIYGC